MRNPLRTGSVGCSDFYFYSRQMKVDVGSRSGHLRVTKVERGIFLARAIFTLRVFDYVSDDSCWARSSGLRLMKQLRLPTYKVSRWWRLQRGGSCSRTCGVAADVPLPICIFNYIRGRPQRYISCSESKFQWSSVLNPRCVPRDPLSLFLVFLLSPPCSQFASSRRSLRHTKDCFFVNLWSVTMFRLDRHISNQEILHWEKKCCRIVLLSHKLFEPFLSPFQWILANSSNTRRLLFSTPAIY